MKLAKKIFMLCVMTAMICVPASAEDVTIDMSLLMFGSANLTVNVDGELSNALSGTYTPYDVVTVQAPNVAGKNFNYWTNVDGKIISYSAALTLTIYSNTVLNAVYGTETVTAQPAAEFLSVTRSGNQIMFNVMATAESDITEYGIRYSTTKNSIDGLKGDDGVTAEKAGSSATNWLFNVTASDDTTCYAVAYVTSGGETYYSDVKAVTLSELDDGVVTIAMLIDLLLGERLDNISEKVITNLQANLCAVTYDANGGSGTMSPQGFVKNTASALTANTFTRSYYTFTGWNTKADGTGTSYQDGASVSLTENTTLYAQWRPLQYAISYALNGGRLSSVNPASYTIESEAITLNNPTKDGYQFDGWTGTELSGKTQTVTIPTGTTGDRSYTANFSPIVYTISYALNGGRLSSVNPASYTIESVDITLNNPTKTGYTFEGWTGTGLTGATKAVTIAGHSTGNRSYTANWTLIQYDISFDLGGGIFPEESPTSYNYETETFKLNTPTKEGYEFLGWSVEGIGGLSMDVTIPQGSTENRQYTANWKAREYSLSYELNGGTVSLDNPAKYTIESEDITLTNPTKDGYEFTGWSGTSVDITMSKDVIIPTGSTGNREYVANWTGNVLPESPDVLRSMSVEISGDETLTTNAGTSASITFTANVKGTYSRGQTRVLSWDSYVLTWTMGNVEGISFTDGTLTVNESAMAGTHEVEITATAVSGDIRGTDTKTVTVTVIEVAPVQTAPVLTCATTSITVKKGGTIASLTVRADVTSLEWLCSGELPEGLTYRTDGNKFVISGTVSSNAEARDYVYTVLARNEAGTSDAMMITITVSGTGSGTPSAVQVPAEEISNMTDEEIAETIGSKTEVELTGNVENLSETIGRLETLTDVKTLDLSQVTGVSELKLEQTTLESITLEGNQSIKKVEITGNETLTTLNLAGSKVETVDAEGCEKLTSINLEGAENLTSLNVKKTNITTLNVKDCAKLEMVDAKGCENLEEVNLEGCESLEYLDVSETAVTELNVQDCVKLGTIYCASCDLSDINLEGCNNLNDLDCSNNKLLFLDASKLRNLGSLKCSHQRAVKPLARLMNFLDLLLGRGRFAVSAAQEDSTYLENVKNLKAYDEAGNELTVKLDSESGEVEFSGEPAKIAYDYATGFNGVMMDVEVYPSETQGRDNAFAEVGVAPGGCTFGFGIGALGILVLMLNLPRKKAE